MTSAQSILKSLVTYAICIPLAIFLGYLLTDPLDQSTFVTMSVVLAFLCVPLLFRFHYPIMLLCWNMTAVLFFLPGGPQIGMAAVALSFIISFTQQILNKDVKSIPIPEIKRPLIVLLAIILITAEMTGGIGLRSLGGDVYGGRRYISLLLTVLGFYALVAMPIPRKHAMFYVALFFLGQLSALIGDLYPLLGGKVPALFLIFRPSEIGTFEIGTTRFTGATAASAGIFAFMMSKYGIRGIFALNHPWRFAAFIAMLGLGLLGGFRSLLIGFILIFVVQFILEGLHRTRMLPAMAIVVVLSASIAVMFAPNMPPTIQRAMAFLPVDLDPAVRESATASSEWRKKIWKAVLPQIPQYLFLGKGLALSIADYDYSSQFGSTSIHEDQWGAALAGDYHNGPLSIIIPFGIWGVLAFVWLQVAGYRLLLNNYRYGDSAYRCINCFILASYVTKALMFWVVVGGLVADLPQFLGLLGLSVALNGGKAQPVHEEVKSETASVKSLATILPRQRPVLGAKSV